MKITFLLYCVVGMLYEEEGNFVFERTLKFYP